MKFGRVLGTLVNGAAHPGLKGIPLLVVQLVDEELNPVGAPVIAGDRLGVGPGELVFMEEAMEASLGLDERFVPIDLGIVGRADTWLVRGDAYRG